MLARIRSLKPEHKAHRKIGPLTDRQYRLWVGMVTEADDEGRLVADAGQLRIVVFGYHPRVRVEHVEAALQAVAATGVVRLYVVEGVRYAWFPSWREHQTINKRQDSKLPEYLSSRNGIGTIPEQDGTTPVGSESLGVFGKGTESLGVGAACAEPPPLTTPRIVFKIPAPVSGALDRCPKLGAVRRLRLPEWWQAELRANPGVDLQGEILKAEAYLVTHPERHYKRLDKFLHGWLGRADRELR